MTTLNDALRQIADAAHLDADALIAYAAEDTVSSARHGGMSINPAEGQLLYALVRALQPAHVLEIGVFSGVSSLHLLTALQANATGDLLSYDIDPAAGDAVPDEFEGHWSLVIDDARTAQLPAADLIFEDADHSLEAALDVLTKIKGQGPRLVVSHDYYSHDVYAGGFHVKQAFDTVFGEPNVIGVRFDDGQRGFGLWFNPDWTAPVVEPPVKKPSRSKRKAAGDA